jgi:hypothetical protein
MSDAVFRRVGIKGRSDMGTQPSASRMKLASRKERPSETEDALNQNTDAQQLVPTVLIYVFGGVGA